MKFCKNCSAPLDDSAVYCSECGASLAGEFDSNGSEYKSEFTQSAESTNSYQTNEHTIPQGSSDGVNYSYNTNNTHYSQPSKGSNPGLPWLIVSIVSFCCCCNIFFSIPGLVLSILSMTSFNAGNIEQSKNRARIAMILVIIGIVLQILLSVVYYPQYQEIVDTMY